MIDMRHWYNQNAGEWPVLACGERVRDRRGDEFTVYMAQVTCPACRAVIQRELERLKNPDRPTKRGVLSRLLGQHKGR